MNGDRLRIAVGEPGPGMLLVAVAGSCDLDNASEIDFALAQAPGADVFLDLSGVTYLDSTTLNVLLGVQRWSEQTGTRLAIVRASDIVMRVLELAHLDELFDVLDPESAGLELDARTRADGGSVRSLFLRLNERDRRLASTHDHPDELDLFCECADTSCWRVVSVPADLYAWIRLDPNRYVLHPVHGEEAPGAVVEASELYVVVRDDAGVPG